MSGISEFQLKPGEKGGASTRTLFGLSASQIQPFVIAVAFLLFFLAASGVLLTYPLATAGHVDFRPFYVAGYMIRTGHGAELYDEAQHQEFQNRLVGPAVGSLPPNHLAYESLIYAPFSYLSYRVAYLAFLVFNLVVLAGTIRLVWSYFSPLQEIWSLLPGAIVLCFFPVAVALIEGQDSLILLAIIAAAVSAMDKQKEFLAGILLGLTLFKFQYALPIAFLYLIWRRWRFLAGFTASGVAVAGVSLWLTGLSGFLKYARYIFSISAHFSSATGTRYGIHLEGMANLRGLVNALAGGSSPAAFLVTAALSLIIVVWAGLKRPSLPGALLAAILVSYHHVISDASLLVLPLGLLLAGWMKSGSPPGARLAALAGTTYIAVPVLLFSGAQFWLLTLPLLALFALWDGIYLSQKGGGQGISRPQKETN